MLQVRHLKKSIPGIIATIMTLVAGLVSVIRLLQSGLLPYKYIAILSLVFIAAILLVAFLTIKSSKKIAHIIGFIISILIIILSIYGTYALSNSIGALDRIMGQTKKKITLSIIVLKDSPIQEIEDIEYNPLGAVMFIDKKYINKIKDESKASQIVDFKSYSTLTESLKDEQSTAIILNEAYREMIDEYDKTFSKDTRIIKSYDFYEENEKTDQNAISTDKSFNIYISGIDTYGDISTVSRSDVNIVATVNPKTNKVLLTTIPRDSYVTIPLGGAGQRDKLTHAGIYGVDTSIAAIQGLLDIKIAGYLRINFTSLINMVDVVGGVTVNNPRAFTTDDGQSFSAGNITLDGKKALTFSRERYNLAGGDNDRGKNQQLVIAGIINKITAPETITRYQSILGVLGNSVQTNITNDTLTKFINYQINKGSAWNTDSISLTGKGQTGGLTSYAMPNARLYMYVLNPDSIADAKLNINQYMQE